MWVWVSYGESQGHGFHPVFVLGTCGADVESDLCFWILPDYGISACKGKGVWHSYLDRNVWMNRGGDSKTPLPPRFCEWELFRCRLLIWKRFLDQFILRLFSQQSQPTVETISAKFWIPASLSHSAGTIGSNRCPEVFNCELVTGVQISQILIWFIVCMLPTWNRDVRICVFFFTAVLVVPLLYIAWLLLLLHICTTPANRIFVINQTKITTTI